MSHASPFYLPDPDNMAAEIESGWIEIRCAVPIEGSPLVPWVELRSAVHTWKQSGLLNQFFFVRKPPGLRLRFEPTDPRSKFIDTLNTWFSLMVKQDLVIHFQCSTYEHEARRFGGDDGMAIAHQHWTLDSELVLEYECLSGASRGSIPRTALWATLVNDLFRETLDDSAEIWDVWCRLDEAFTDLNAEFGDVRRLYNSVAPGMFAGPKSWQELLPSALEVMLKRAHNSNLEAANQLKMLLRGGALNVGVRSWLTANSIFQANRWGLGLNALELRAAVSAMRQYLEPDAGREAHSSNG